MGSTTATTDLELAVHEAVAAVDDPEYPGVSIVDLGLLEVLEVTNGGAVRVGLIPTFSGCPALAMIANDVRESVVLVPGVSSIQVDWLKAPVWTVERVSMDARAQIADQFTVAVQIGTAPPPCPLCGAPTTEVSMFGPSRCRAINRCSACAETVEVLRS